MLINKKVRLFADPFTECFLKQDEIDNSFYIVAIESNRLGQVENELVQGNTVKECIENFLNGSVSVKEMFFPLVVIESIITTFDLSNEDITYLINMIDNDSAKKSFHDTAFSSLTKCQGKDASKEL